MEQRRCPQCYLWKPLAEFAGKRKAIVGWCAGCRALYHGAGGHRRTRRGGLDAPELRVLLFDANPRAFNSKLGPIPNSMTSGETCPDACGLRDGGCYAEFGVVAMHWRRVPTEGVPWEEFIERIRWLPSGQLWRHNTAGELPGVGNALDVDRLLQLVASNLGRRGFTMTRKPLLGIDDRAAVEVANREGFTVNVTAHGLHDADVVAERFAGCAPVVVVLPHDAPAQLKTPAGRTVTVCPAQTHDHVTCADCQLCSRPGRSAIIGFRAHGQWKAKVSELVQLRRKAA